MFAIYETRKENLTNSAQRPSLAVLIPAAAISGFLGGIVGTPADAANVRMQHDASLPEGARRSYRSVFDTLASMGRDEGLKVYVRGLWPNCFRAAGMTCCQLAS